MKPKLEVVRGETLTPGLLDLMEHEKVIEQGLHTFVEVGTALLAIRDGRKYKAAGYSTFETYCRERWQMSRRHADRVILAAQESETRGSHFESEREARRERSKAKPREHPATFSDSILRRIGTHVESAHTVVDPFAGTGRVHELRNIAHVEQTIGIEIEPEWAAMHSDTICGDSQQLSKLVKSKSVDAIVTSPTYGNRMADHHDAQDESARHTYKHTLGRDLDPSNSGAMQWGDEYRRLHSRVWREAVKVLAPDGVFVLNVKNHVRGGEVQRVAEWHIRELLSLGLTLEAIDVVHTYGMTTGEGDKLDFELVVVMRR